MCLILVKGLIPYQVLKKKIEGNKVWNWKIEKQGTFFIPLT